MIPWPCAAGFIPRGCPRGTYATLLSALCVGVLYACVARTAAQDNSTPLNRALQIAGLSSPEIRIDPIVLNTFDHHPARLAIVEWALANPLTTPMLGDYIAGNCTISQPHDTVNVLAQISRWLGNVVRRGLIGDPLERAKKLSGVDAPLIVAIERAHRLAGATLPADARKAIQAQTAGVAPDQLRSVALLLQTICDAHEWAELALAEHSSKDWTELLADLRKTTAESDDNAADQPPFSTFRRDRAVRDAVQEFDPSLMFVGSQEIAFAVDALTRTLQDRQATPNWSLSVSTPIGLVSIGREHHLSGKQAPLLLIDWGGNDRYAILATSAAEHRHVSVAIDFGGDDHYVNTTFDDGNFGAGICGIGMLFDLAGNDEYRMTRNGLGYAAFGVGMLYDQAGDDTYTAVEHAQASAYAGAAALIDVAGNDHYDIYTHGQAYAGPRAGAVLADVAGDDRYIANDTDIRFPSSQSKTHNDSLAQGAGFGWRADYKEGLSIPGGVGVLFDGGGSDEYTCGLFGQGVGYWLGMGLLIDRDGNDHYQGQWYVQGASAHFAAGILLDTRGDDQYEAYMNMAQGAGHDVGIGVLFDNEGDDRYKGPSLSLGAGNAAGLGLFVDRKGDDHYDVTGGNSNLGYASANRLGTLRAAIPAIGMFFDLAGRDHYPHKRGDNGTHWGSTPPPPHGVLRGIAHGVDLGDE